VTDISVVRSHELTTKTALQNYLGINDDTPELFVAIRLMKAATDFIEGQLISSDIMRGGYCSRRFKATDYTLAKYSGQGFRDLLMRQFPINSITTIIIGDTTEFPSGSDTLADLGFYVDAEITGNIINTGIWTTGDPQNIEITYNAGFSEIPFDLEMAAIGMVALKYNIYSKHMEGFKSEKTGLYSYTLADTNEENPFGGGLIKDILEQFRKPSF
jgi:hypothetical protein